MGSHFSMSTLNPPASLWAATASPPSASAELSGDITTDIAIIGGGFTGLSTSVHLGEIGVDSVLIEAGSLGYGGSGRNGGQAIPGLKFDPDDLEEMMGPELGPRLVREVGGGPELAFELIDRYAMDCPTARAGWIQPAHCASAVGTVTRRARQWAARGAKIHTIDADEVARLTGTQAYVGGLIDHRGGGLQPLSYARGLGHAAASLGVRLFDNTRADRLSRTNGRWTIDTPRGRITARAVVLATNAYTTGTLVPGLERTIVPIYSYQIATRPLTQEERASILPEGHVASDTRRLLRYYRFDSTGRLLMGGRAPFKEVPDMGDAPPLQAAIADLYPQLAGIGIDYVWSGRVGMTVDHLPHLHVPEDGLFAAIGYNGRGVALGTVMGRQLARLAAGDPAESAAFPITGVKPMRFHGLNRPVLETLIRYYRWRDNREARQVDRS